MSKLLIDGGKESITVDALPDFCPVCKFGVNPDYLLGLRCDVRDNVNALFVCPRNSCKKMFIASYKMNFMSGSFYLKSLLPRTPVSPTVVQEIVEISPSFEDIYKQAFEAESYGLTEIAGVGFRKSLEYLIKDYCIIQNPEKEEDIKKRPVAQVIDSFVSNENIKQCAKRAVWLGNDETHYVRKWGDKDITDLKLLIQITVGWIQQEVITKKLLNDMQ